MVSRRKVALAAVDLMDRTGLSVSKLAERLKWSQRNLYYYRSGEPMPPHIRFALKWLAHERITMTKQKIKVGTTVEAGTGEDHDTGRVERIDGDIAYVAWASGVKTSAPLLDLRPL